MSIREALGRVQIDEESTSASMQDSASADWDKRMLIESSYEKKILEKGRSILGEAGLPGLLNELAEIIKPNFPDVKINEQRIANGAVSLGIEWNFQDRPDRETSPRKYSYNNVSVSAYPLTEDIVVGGKGGGELL